MQRPDASALYPLSHCRGCLLGQLTTNKPTAVACNGSFCTGSVLYLEKHIPSINVQKPEPHTAEPKLLIVSTMLAQIVLDQAFSHYTNLDIISGKVIVKTQTSANISSIVVKLEGESRTRLLPPPNPNGDRQKAQLEFHKVGARLRRYTCSIS